MKLVDMMRIVCNGGRHTLVGDMQSQKANLVLRQFVEIIMAEAELSLLYGTMGYTQAVVVTVEKHKTITTVAVNSREILHDLYSQCEGLVGSIEASLRLQEVLRERGFADVDTDDTPCGMVITITYKF